MPFIIVIHEEFIGETETDAYEQMSEWFRNPDESVDIEEITQEEYEAIFKC